MLTEALGIIKSEGVGALSIRKVARNLGFSHGAASLMLNGVTEHLVADQKTRAALSAFIEEKIFVALR